LIQKVETILIQSGEFRLPGKKQLYQNANIWSVVAVNVTESPIERPKKNSEATRQEKAAYAKSSSGSQSSYWTDYLYGVWQRASP
jgi:hypothetical protein